jgi:hypothetical protein
MSEETNSGMWKKGCLIAAAVVLMLGCCGFVLGSFACNSAYTAGQQLMSEQLVAGLRQASEGHPREAEYLAEIDHYEQTRTQIGLVTFSIVTNRYGDISADRTITPEELDRMMALLIDIHAHNGNVNIADYPGAR